MTVIDVESILHFFQWSVLGRPHSFTSKERTAGAERHFCGRSASPSPMRGNQNHTKRLAKFELMEWVGVGGKGGKEGDVVTSWMKSFQSDDNMERRELTVELLEEMVNVSPDGN